MNTNVKSKKLCIASAALMISLILTACSARTPVDPGVFQSASEELGLTVTVFTEEQLAETAAGTFLTAVSDTAMAELVVFNDDTSAKTTYAQFLAQITETGKEEKRVDSTTYSKYIYEGDSNYYALVRVNNSVFYAKGDKSEGTIQSLVEKIGYK